MELRTGAAFWPVRDGCPASYPPLHGDATADVAIVGAGITGALVAYELTRSGVDVIVLDSHDVVSGSSAVTTGLLLYDTDTSLEALLAQFGPIDGVRAYRAGLDAIDRIERICTDVGDSCGFSRRPSFYLASSEADVSGLHREYQLRTEHGFDVTFLRRSELASRGIRAPAAIQARGTGEIDAYRFAHRLLAAASAGGARIHAHSPVTRFRHSDQCMTVELAHGGVVRASRVVCATGYEAATHLQRHTGNLASTWVCVSQPIEDFSAWPDRSPMWETARPYVYIRSTEDGRLMAGGEDEPWSAAHRDASRLEEKSRRVLARVGVYLPDLHVVPEYCFAGTFATTDDGLPFIGEAPECPGVWFALGYGGNGITFSVVAAEILRDAYLRRANPNAALFGFSRTKVGAG